jgi:hypothetical protein
VEAIPIAAGDIVAADLLDEDNDQQHDEGRRGDLVMLEATTPKLAPLLCK